MPSLYKSCIAEIIGTFAILLFGIGSIIINQQTGGAVGHLGVSLTFGLTVMVMIYTFGEISGAHFNPAVTIAFWVSGTFPAKHILPYLTAQFAGAILGTGALAVLFPGKAIPGATVPSDTLMQSFMMEMLLSFFLMLVIIHVAKGSKEQGLFAGLAIGTIVILAALFGGPVSGASMNPARTLGPAIFSGNWSGIWVYFTAPVIGTVLAAGLWKGLKA